MDNMTVAYTLAAFFGLLTGYFLATYFSSWHNRYMFGKRVRCFFGKHEPGPVRDVVGGRRRQHCDWCDAVVHEYTVTKDQLKGETIRRVF